MYKIFAVKNENIFDITEIAGNITWSDSLNTLGTQMNFSLAYNDEKYLPDININVGDKIILKNEFEIFRGIITDLEKGSRGSINYTVFDFAFYLNKSSIVMQYDKMQADKAIIQLCGRLNINVGKVDAMNKLITKIYKSETAADIIKDIINQECNESGKKYLIEMRADKLYIIEMPKDSIEVLYKSAENVGAFDVTKMIGNPSKSMSIQEMKNSIIIISDNEKETRVIAEAKNNNNINVYGLLSAIETVNNEDYNRAQNIADNKLKELDKITESISIELLGNDEVRSGRILYIEESFIGIKGNYLVKSCSHTLSNDIHKMSLELELIQ